MERITLSLENPFCRSPFVSIKKLLLLALPLGILIDGGYSVRAQLPFYTDDTIVTESGKSHFEFFNEYDAFQLQDPNHTQNTANFKFNYGLPHSFEVDVDFPYLSIYRTEGKAASNGFGDTNLGVKRSFREESAGSRIPALAASSTSNFQPEMRVNSWVPGCMTTGST